MGCDMGIPLIAPHMPLTRPPIPCRVSQDHQAHQRRQGRSEGALGGNEPVTGMVAGCSTWG